MKYLIILSFVLSIAGTATAATYTCSNNPTGGAQYSTLNDAYNACALSGDTILLQSSETDYTISPDWEKSIVVIGRGLTGTGSSTISSRIDMRTLGSGSEFYGIDFSSYLNVQTTTDSVAVFNCRFNGSYGVFFQNSGTEWSFTNCIFSGSATDKVYLPGGANAVSAIFRSCLFVSNVFGADSPNHSLLFDHCIFMKNTTGANDGHFENVRNAVISNSIFMNASPIVDDQSIDNVFQNNLYPDTMTMPPANNLGAGNIPGDPSFVSFTGPFYSESDEYELIGGSPGTGAAVDGSDVGLHGGNAGFNEELEPAIVPIITSVLIQNAVVGPGATLNVDLEGRSPVND
ncbi:MAG: hypothetical protein HKN45_08605 [Flavobacteriales bacterium]|nr:hypothetical protein [Flavobacteriales bacterium]